MPSGEAGNFIIIIIFESSTSGSFIAKSFSFKILLYVSSKKKPGGTFHTLPAKLFS